MGSMAGLLSFHSTHGLQWSLSSSRSRCALKVFRSLSAFQFFSSGTHFKSMCSGGGRPQWHGVKKHLFFTLLKAISVLERTFWFYLQGKLYQNTSVNHFYHLPRWRCKLLECPSSHCFLQEHTEQYADVAGLTILLHTLQSWNWTADCIRVQISGGANGSKFSSWSLQLKKGSPVQETYGVVGRVSMMDKGFTLLPRR